MRSYRAQFLFIIIPVVICFAFSGYQAYSQDLDTIDLNRVSDLFEALSEEAGPSIVQVFASGYVVPQGCGQTGNLITRQIQSGSGVILGEDGYIVTNAHVVNGAQRVQVLLARKNNGSPGRLILKPRGEAIDAEVLAIDSETDLAVLKIPVTGLPVLELGDSDELRSGQLVFAFGSPLGLDSSVSMGVISSVARQLRPDDPMIYIQTDASINPGNSGGPLIDTNGRVIGINTFILSQSGGKEGIGFAAPSNIVRNVYYQIRVSGRVRRGEIGVNAQTITPEIARGLGLSRN
jgi:serine protease Do